MISKHESKDKIACLVENFGSKIDLLKKTSNYKEAQVEDEFIKPLFRYLNWNVSNEGIANLSHREFVVQAKGRNHKEPDYLLQLDGKPLFYMEAKHPKYDLFNRIDYIWQAYSYAYSTQSSGERNRVDFAVLTDFEEFRVFDCTFKAEPETVNNYAVINWKFNDYINNFDNLWEIFEKENIRKHRLEPLRINEKKIKQNRIPPDKAFLADLDDDKTGWRILLAKDIKKLNPELSAEEITFAVQRIIDRFVFIKVLSDREIEDDFLSHIINDINKAALKSDEGILNESCRDIFQKINNTYNGSFFRPTPELDKIKFSNKTLKNILTALTPEKSRYNFKLIPVEILGTIYEQFLGKIVTSTEKRVTIEYKPEVRKAGGVYYTPQYIVDYIVENTLGELLKKCESIEDMFKIKICDPACGSGSFLLGAYYKLLIWAADFYFKKYKSEKQVTKKDSNYVYRDTDGTIRLTSKLKREILRSCIYGVDIDPQAVEVTTLSLSLKALEGIRREELYEEVDLFHEKALPDLSGNIKCGNSLIGPDFYDGELLITPEEERKIRPFDWKEEFKEVFTQGGFDCIIGNPPYFNIDDTWGKNNLLQKYIKEKYYYIYNDKTDILFYFLAKAINQSKSKVGFIVSRAFLEAYKANKLRGYISQNSKIDEIIDFRNYQIFEGVGITTLTLILSKDKLNDSPVNIFQMTDTQNKLYNLFIQKNDILSFKKYSCKNSYFSNDNWTFSAKNEENIISKIDTNSDILSKVCYIGKGMETGRNKIFGGINKSKLDEFMLSKEQYYMRARNSDIQRYYIKRSDEYLLYLENESKFSDLQKLLQEYLIENEKILKERAAYKRGDCEWWKYTWPLHKEYYQRKKIYSPYMAKFNRFCLDEKNEFLGLTDTTVIFDNNQEEDIKYILALLNSKLLTFRYKFMGKLKSGNVYEYFWNTISNLPIKRINMKIENEKSLHDEIVKLVEKMFVLNKELNETKLPYETNNIKRQITNTDKTIDSLVYKLYGLTNDEIKIVEGNKH